MQLKFKKCLLCSGKCICSAFRSLQWINLILTFMSSIESETFHGSIKNFISLNKIFLFVSLTYRCQYREQHNLNLEYQMTSCVAMWKLYIKYLSTSNNKHFLYKTLFSTTFVLYNISKLRADLFELLDKTPCD